MEDENSAGTHKRTVGVKCRQKKFQILLSDNEELINVVFWDTGNEAILTQPSRDILFQGINGVVSPKKTLTLQRHYRRAHAAIIVFDVEKSQTYEDALGMIEEFKTFKQQDAICILLANKSKLEQTAYALLSRFRAGRCRS